MGVCLLRRKKGKQKKKAKKHVCQVEKNVNHEHTRACWKQHAPSKNNGGHREMENDALDIGEAVGQL